MLWFLRGIKLVVWSKDSETMLLDTIFMLLFPVYFNPTSSLSLSTTFSFLHSFPYVSSHSRQMTRNTVQLILLHRTTYSWHQLSDCPLVYLLIGPPKQSVSSTRSCTGTTSATHSASHRSKFRTSWTWNTRSSASPAWRLDWSKGSSKPQWQHLDDLEPLFKELQP